jgi:hypothetical protein
VFLDAVQGTSSHARTQLEQLAHHSHVCMTTHDKQCACTCPLPLALDVCGLPFQLQLLATPVYVSEVRALPRQYSG